MDAVKEHRFRLGRRFSLGRNKHFQYVYRRGKSFPSKLLVLVYLKARDVKVGFSVSSKVGNSVVRNRIRRCLREDFRMRRPDLAGGKYIFIARSASARAAHPDLTREMASLLRKAGVTQ